MALSKFPFRAGMVKDGTQYTAGMSWYDGDKVRFKRGRVQQIGGWEKFSNTKIFGICRSIMDWTAINGTHYFGFGTTSKFYISQGGSFMDATPVGTLIGTGLITFTATTGDPLILVDHVGHGRSVGDFVKFQSAASLGGNIISTELPLKCNLNRADGFRVVALGATAANQYYITAVDSNWDIVLPTAGDTGDGTPSTTAEYLIPTGTDAFLTGTGWGVGGWGSGGWGSTTPLSFSGQLRLYSQEPFGNDLIFNPRGAGIYFWDESSGFSAAAPNRGVNIADIAGAASAPTICLQVIVSEADRHVIALGCNNINDTAIDPLLVRWSDEENVLDWQPLITNSAGGQRLPIGSYIVGGVRTRQEILIFTDKSIHSMRFGGEFVFSFSIIAESVTMVSPKAGVAVGDLVFFMDKDAFYVYRGSVEPIECSVSDYVYDNLNKLQQYKIFATHNPDFEEVTWFYPVGEGPTEVTNYVIYNYKENHWSVGTMVRGAWFSAPSWKNPLSADAISETGYAPSNCIYNQEVGYDADGEEMGAYIESGGIELGDGEHYHMISRFIPDLRVTGADGNLDMLVTLNGRDFPFDDFVTKDTATVDNASKQLHVRARTREVAIKMEFSGTGYRWTLGEFRFDLRPDGRR